MPAQSETPAQFLDLQGHPVVVSFLAMEYYGVMFNRSYAVIATKKAVCGAKVFGTVASPRGVLGAFKWRDPRNFIDRKTREKYHSIDPESPAFLQINKDNFQIATDTISAIGFSSKKKLSMGGVPHSGSLIIHLVDGHKRELILLGDQNGPEIERLMLGICASANRVTV
jgi:hypothetical protein